MMADDSRRRLCGPGSGQSVPAARWARRIAGQPDPGGLTREPHRRHPPRPRRDDGAGVSIQNHSCFNLGDLPLSHTLARAVPPALKRLTSVFGMGTGVTPSLQSLKTPLGKSPSPSSTSSYSFPTRTAGPAFPQVSPVAIAQRGSRSAASTSIPASLALRRCSGRFLMKPSRSWRSDSGHCG